MKTNSIENFKTGNHTYKLSYGNKAADIEIITARKAKPEFDIHREITNRTFIRPLPPKGHIIKPNLLSAPRIFVDDVLNDVKALKSAWKGTANDHQLGKLNDLGMKVGGLAIAAYLFSMRHTPITKAMEFVGFTSFFASMALWPKIALDIPARLIHGFSPFMRYEDSEGRKKRFFQDNQYIPFDMLSDKDINRIGNRLGISKDQINRREAVEEKMRQIALQNNTLWMLTAGFATPIVSSLICNKAEPYIESLYNSKMNNKINKILKNFVDESKKFKTNNISESIENLIILNKNKPITQSTIQDFAKALTSQLGSNVERGLQKDLVNMFLSDKYLIPETHVSSIVTRIESLLTTESKGKLLPQTVREIIPTEAEIKTLFESKGYLNNSLSKLEIREAITGISSIIANKIEAMNSGEGVLIKPNMQTRLIKVLGEESRDKALSIEGILTSRPANILDRTVETTLRDLAKIFTDISAEHTALNVYAYHKLAQAPNTSKAKYWNDSVNALIKALKITDKELELTHYDRKLVGELFNKKMWEAATADSSTYMKFIEDLAKEFDKIKDFVTPDKFKDDFLPQAKATYSGGANQLRAKGFRYAADKLFRSESTTTGTTYGATRAFTENNLTNLKATFSSVINKANIYRTIFKDPNLSFIGASGLSQEVKEELVALIEYLTTEGRISDYTVKFDFLRNLTPDSKVAPLEIKVKDGIKYNFYSAEQLAADGVVIKSDIKFYRNIMNALFNTALDPDTISALPQGAMDRLKEYRKNMFSDVANINNFMFPEHVMEMVYQDGHFDAGKTYTHVRPKARSQMVGASLDEVLTNSLKQLYNTKKWLKIFGIKGALGGLLGLTVLAQFLFGRSGSKNNNESKGKV